MRKTTVTPPAGKTWAEWMDILPEEIREKAEVNFKARFRSEKIQEVLAAYRYIKLGSCLGSSFIWLETPEGFDYWIEVIDKHG